MFPQSFFSNSVERLGTLKSCSWYL